VLNTVLYKVVKPEASVGETIMYGAGTAATTRALSNLGPVRGIGPDFIVGAARTGTAALPKEIGEPIDTALAPFDPNKGLELLVEGIARRGKLSPRSEEENRKIIQLYIPAGEAIRHYGLGGPGL
jgi:hypothetical protein